jgi:hypothetical protein
LREHANDGRKPDNNEVSCADQNCSLGNSIESAAGRKAKVVAPGDRPDLCGGWQNEAEIGYLPGNILNGDGAEKRI